MKLIYICLFLLFNITVGTQTLYEKQIIPFDGELNDSFGRDVAICDSFIFIGSRGDNNYTGAVYIYKKIDESFLFFKKIYASDPTNHARFGAKLLYENSELFVGAGLARSNNIQAGAVYHFKWENGDWIEKQKIVPPQLQPFGTFGYSISKYNECLLIGAYDYNYQFDYAGRAFLYREVNNLYTFTQELLPSDPQYIGRFGSAVAQDKDLILVASVQDSTQSGDFSGSVYVFRKNDSLWIEKEKLVPPTNSDNLGFGNSIFIKDNYVFIGAPGDIGYVGPGSVYIYEKKLNQISYVSKINSGGNYDYDGFGYPIVVQGDSLLIGAPYDTTNGFITGAVYLFTYNSTSWIKEKKFTPSDYQNSNDYGISIDFINQDFLIGAPDTRVNGVRIGKAYLYNDVPVSVEGELLVNDLDGFKLYQNFPNPFNSSTTLNFSIPNDGFVEIKVYDVLGQNIKTISGRFMIKGFHSIVLELFNMPSGIYFYKIELSLEKNNWMEKITLTKKAILIK